MTVRLAKWGTRSNKYRAISVNADGEHFASRKEFSHYCTLKILQQAGQITRLELHPRFKLLGYDGAELGITYVADFGHYEANARVITDVKSEATLTDLCKLKLRLLKAQLPGIEIRLPGYKGSWKP